jgi:hypothetical protein
LRTAFLVTAFLCCLLVSGFFVTVFLRTALLWAAFFRATIFVSAGRDLVAALAFSSLDAGNANFAKSLKVWMQIGGVAEAERAAALGADALIVQGAEAGGHNRLRIEQADRPGVDGKSARRGDRPARPHGCRPIRLPSPAL